MSNNIYIYIFNIYVFAFFFFFGGKEYHENGPLFSELKFYQRAAKPDSSKYLFMCTGKV